MVFNNSPTLRIHKPSQAITNFTVTNVPPSTKWHQILFYTTFLMRFILVVTAICLISLKFQPRQVHSLTSFIPTLFQPALSHLSAVAGWLNAQGVLSLALFIISISLFSLCEYKEETITVIKNIGVRLSSANVGWWGRSEVSERPIMLDHLEDMVIHEGFIGTKVKLAIMVRGEDNLVVAFPVNLLCFFLWFCMTSIGGV